jgi:hypothetical protein
VVTAYRPFGTPLELCLWNQQRSYFDGKMTIVAPGTLQYSLGRRHSDMVSRRRPTSGGTGRQRGREIRNSLPTLLTSVLKRLSLSTDQMVHPHSHTAQALSTAFRVFYATGLRCIYGYWHGHRCLWMDIPCRCFWSICPHSPCLCQTVKGRGPTVTFRYTTELRAYLNKYDLFSCTAPQITHLRRTLLNGNT